jgi:predicted PurR-regulated permease PerM
MNLEPNPQSSPASTRSLPRAFLVFLVVALALNLWLVFPYLLALFLGWILSTVVKPVYEWLTGKKIERHLAAILALLGASFSVILPSVALGFSVVRTLTKLVNQVSQSGFDWAGLETRVYEWPLVNRLFESESDLHSVLTEGSQRALSHSTQLLSNVLASFPGLLLQTVLALLTSYYILLEGPRFRAFMAIRVPLSKTTQSQLMKGLTDTAYSSFLSMMAAAVAQATLVFAGFLMLGVPFAGLSFGLSFVSAWIPILGVTPVWGAAALYLLSQQRYGAAIGMVLFGVGAGFIDNVVRPWVLKGRSDLHPLLSLVAIFGAVHTFGVMGVLVGPVALACAIEFLKHWPDFARELGLQGRDA